MANSEQLRQGKILNLRIRYLDWQVHIQRSLINSVSCENPYCISGWSSRKLKQSCNFCIYNNLCEVIAHFNQNSLYCKSCSSDYYALWAAAHICVWERSCPGKFSEGIKSAIKFVLSVLPATLQVFFN